jgi:hypothetical protein
MINGEFQAFLTFMLHLIVIDWIWKLLEINIAGKENGNLPDSILLVLLCLYITWILRYENKMNGYEFMEQHPYLIGFIATIIGITVISTVEAITKIWRNPDEQKNQEEES